MNTCACGCGEIVSGTWKRGHHRRVRAGLASVRTARRPAQVIPVFDAGQGRSADYPADPVQVDERPWYEQEVAAAAEQSYGPADADPEPGYMDVAHKSPISDIGVVLDPKTRADIKGKLALFSMIPAEAFYLLDPYCADALSKSLPKMIEAAIPLIAGSPQALEFFQSKSKWAPWLGLGMASKGFVLAVIAHHVTHKVHVETGEDGSPQVIKTDYSAYTAA